MEKRCPRCGLEKAEDEFYKNPKTGKTHTYCRPCAREWHAEWNRKNPEKRKQITKRYGDANPDKRRERRKRWLAKNPGADRAATKAWEAARPGIRNNYASKYRDRNRREAFEAYGGFRCACCGETEPVFLSIDHINNDGAAHRKVVGSRGGSEFFAWLRRNGYPPGFQVLCLNCNIGKHRNGGVCPHLSTEGSSTIPSGSTP